MTWEEKVLDDSFAEGVKHHLKGQGGIQVGNQAVSKVAGVFTGCGEGLGRALVGGRVTDCPALLRLRAFSRIRDVQGCNWDSWSPYSKRRWYVGRGEAG